jgi:hypothetical protein
MNGLGLAIVKQADFCRVRDLTARKPTVAKPNVLRCCVVDSCSYYKGAVDLVYAAMDVLDLTCVCVLSVTMVLNDRSFQRPARHLMQLSGRDVSTSDIANLNKRIRDDAERHRVVACKVDAYQYLSASKKKRDTHTKLKTMYWALWLLVPLRHSISTALADAKSAAAQAFDITMTAAAKERPLAQAMQLPDSIKLNFSWNHVAVCAVVDYASGSQLTLLDGDIQAVDEGAATRTRSTAGSGETVSRATYHSCAGAFKRACDLGGSLALQPGDVVVDVRRIDPEEIQDAKITSSDPDPDPDRSSACLQTFTSPSSSSPLNDLYIPIDFRRLKLMTTSDANTALRSCNVPTGSSLADVLGPSFRNHYGLMVVALRYSSYVERDPEAPIAGMKRMRSTSADSDSDDSDVVDITPSGSGPGRDSHEEAESRSDRVAAVASVATSSSALATSQLVRPAIAMEHASTNAVVGDELAASNLQVLRGSIIADATTGQATEISVCAGLQLNSVIAAGHELLLEQGSCAISATAAGVGGAGTASRPRNIPGARQRRCCRTHASIPLGDHSIDPTLWLRAPVYEAVMNDDIFALRTALGAGNCPEDANPVRTVY